MRGRTKEAAFRVEHMHAHFFFTQKYLTADVCFSFPPGHSVSLWGQSLASNGSASILASYCCPTISCSATKYPTEKGKDTSDPHMTRGEI